MAQCMKDSHDSTEGEDMMGRDDNGNEEFIFNINRLRHEEIASAPEEGSHRELTNAANNSGDDDQRSEKIPSQVLSGLYRQWTQEASCDVTLVLGDGAGEVRFPAHRVVLAASSKYFDAMFQGGMIEANQSEIRLPTLQTEPFKKILKFFYTGTIRITEVDVQDILETSNYLAVEAVCQSACTFLSKNMTCDNCLGILQLADNLAQTELYAYAADFVQENFMTVFCRESFLEQPRGISVSKLAEILSGDNLHVLKNWDCETVPIQENIERRLLAFVLRYAEAIDQEQLKGLSALLRAVRLPQLFRSDLDHLADHPQIKRNDECKKLVDLALAKQRGFDVAHEAIESSWNRLRDTKGSE